jgi:hypothetical protein
LRVTDSVFLFVEKERVMEPNFELESTFVRPSRRRLFQALTGGVAALAMASIPMPVEAAPTLSNSDVNILNFALNLEYLEAEFYLYATTGTGLTSADTSGKEIEGATTGGAAVPFTDNLLQATAEELAVDELAHVRYLRTALGRKAVAKPAINLAALGIGFANETEFQTLARAFEDVGVSAYGGAATAIKNKKILGVAARILATEAYHAGNIRFQVVQDGISVPAVDSLDQPPTATNFFPTDTNGLALIRTIDQVLTIVRPFFPNGLNGRFR